MTQPTELFQYVHPATGCAKCPVLVQERHTIVWGSGPPQADLMMIGEAPGFNEDREGLPFVGQAGGELSKLLQEAGIDRREVHIANRIMCRPPGNRDPEPAELLNCEPWLVEHVRMVQPRAVVLFGRYAIGWRFDRTKVMDTQGLMYLSWCDTCGEPIHRPHLPRAAQDGSWISTPVNMQEHKTSRRLVAAIYHPASILGGRNPEYRPLIVHQLRRLKAELELLA